MVKNFALLMETQTAYLQNDRNERSEYENNEASLSASIRGYVNGMYDEFKRCYDQKNIARIDKIVKNITNVDPDSNILNIIEGTLFLHHGDGANAYKYLFQFAKNSKSIDLWALNVMAMWNMITGQHKLAYKQFSNVIEGPFSNKFTVSVLINAAKTKKKLGFLDKSLEYFTRLLRIPDGYKMLLVINLEIIHIYILKKQYDLAMQEIEKYLRECDNFFIKRLKVYIYYLKGNLKEILRYKREDEKDPYIMYIIARIGLENPKMFNIDVAYCLDEAIKSVKNNEYIYNTYGNFYYSTQRFSDAAEQYNNALSLDPMFEPALSNLKLFIKANSKPHEEIYITRQDSGHRKTLADVNPDVEELGFLDTWKILGYSTFRVDYFSLQKSPSLKYYISSD